MTVVSVEIRGRAGSGEEGELLRRQDQPGPSPR